MVTYELLTTNMTVPKRFNIGATHAVSMFALLSLGQTGEFQKNKTIYN